jgi:hypothetical protein
MTASKRIRTGERNTSFQFFHCGPDVSGGRFDVVRCGCAHVRVSEDSLDHHIRHTQAIQVASQSSPGCVPAMPFGDASVAPVRMAYLLVNWLCLPARFAPIQRRENNPVDHAAERQGIA